MARKIISLYLAPYRGLPSGVWCISLTILINRSGTMVLPFLALYATDEMGLTPSSAGTLLAGYGVGAVLGNWLGGWFTGKRGPLVVQFASLTLGALGFLLVTLADTVGQLAVCLFLLSLVSEAYRPAAATATTILAPPSMHSRAFALNRLAINLGMSIGPVVGGFLSQINFKWLFYADAATCLLAAIILWMTLGIRQIEVQHYADETQPSAIRSPWRDREFLVVLGLLFAAGLVFFQILGTYVLYLEEQFHFSRPVIGGILAINTVIIVLVEMLVIHHTDRHSRLRMVAGGCVLIGLGFGLLPFGRGIWYAALMMVIWTAGEMLESSPALAWVAGRSTHKNRGAYVAAYSMTMSAALVIAPMLGMTLYDWNPDYLWYASAVLCTIVATTLLRTETRVSRRSSIEFQTLPLNSSGKAGDEKVSSAFGLTTLDS